MQTNYNESTNSWPIQKRPRLLLRNPVEQAWLKSCWGVSEVEPALRLHPP